MEKMWKLLRVGGNYRQQALKAVELQRFKQKQVQRCLAGKEDLLLHHYVFLWLLMILETCGAVGIVYL